MGTAKIPGYEAVPSAPLALWHDKDASGHVVQFYGDDEFLLDSLSRFVGMALAAGDAAVVVVSKTHRDGLAQRLSERGLDTRAALRDGRYVVLDAGETLSKFMVNHSPDSSLFLELMGRVIDQARAAAEGEIPRVAVFGEMVAQLWAEGNPDAAIQLEELWNQLAQTHSFMLRCAYPMKGFSHEEHGHLLGKICATHSAVIPVESYTALMSEEERLLNITELQQKARALETERAEKQEVEKSLRLREAELADVLENAVEGVQQVSADQKVRWANKALLKLLGYRAEEYVDHQLSDFYVHKHVFDELWSRLTGGEDIYDFPADLRCKDGSIKHVLIHSNVLWESGQFIHTRCFIRDVTEQKRMDQALRETKSQLQALVEQRTAALRRLSVRILNLQDSERRRLARELHDSLGQYLTGLKINIDMLRRSPQRSELWQQSEELTAKCISEIRTLSYLLHPPMMDESGLSSAAHWYVQGFGDRSGIKVSLQASDDLDRLPDAVEVALFRILQEALTNVHRHAEASAADIRILRDAEQVILEVRDNGRGISPDLLRRFNETGAGTGVGLTGMHERAREFGGYLKLESDRTGTSVVVTIPLAPEASDEAASLIGNQAGDTPESLPSVA